jgi:hypothetical protein
MKVVNVGDYKVYVSAPKAGRKFKVKLSDLIKTKFQAPYDESNIKEIMIFSLEHYAQEFEKICRNETCFLFYKYMFWLHEQSVELNRNIEAKKTLEAKIGKAYLPIYRRVLKLILEEACLIKLDAKKPKPSYKKVAETLEDLLCLGDEILTMATLLAEQDMIGDVVAMDFDDEGLYHLKRNHYYDLSFEKIVDMNAYESNSFAIDKNADKDFNEVVKNAFHFDFANLLQFISTGFEVRNLDKWDALDISTSGLSAGMKEYFDVPEDNTQAFLSGLCFSKNIKIPIKDVIRKPYSMNRFLNRPILIWNINGIDSWVLGKHSMGEGIDTLLLNAFPWNNAPQEWKDNPVFKTFLIKKESEHERILNDAVEEKIKPLNLIYQPAVKKLVTKAETVHIHTLCGEIDFLVVDINSKKVYVIECKHLLGRYDMANFHMDYKSFTKPKGFNDKIEKKINWIKQNISLVEEHFQAGKKLNTSIQDFTVEGFFVINTPTFYMYYSPFRIYTYHEVDTVLKGEYTDKTYDLLIDEEESITTIFLKYPYFIKKKLIYYDDPYADYPVDKYGQPIIPEELNRTN